MLPPPAIEPPPERRSPSLQGIANIVLAGQCLQAVYEFYCTDASCTVRAPSLMHATGLLLLLSLLLGSQMPRLGCCAR